MLIAEELPLQQHFFGTRVIGTLHEASMWRLRLYYWGGTQATLCKYVISKDVTNYIIEAKRTIPKKKPASEQRIQITNA